MSDVRVLHGDCIELLAGFADNSIDAVVTDPPYGLEFMGREWDRFRVDPDLSVNARHRGAAAGDHGSADRESNHGRHGTVAYGGGKRPKTSRCTGCGKRDQFRKPHQCDDDRHARWVEVLIDPYSAPPTMLAFAEWCRRWAFALIDVVKPGGHLVAFGTRTHHRLMAGIEDAGWDIRDCGVWLYRNGFPKSLNLDGEHTGKGTHLKPAVEPWVLARKPLVGSVAANVATWGTGALNIDDARHPTTEREGGTEPAVQTDGRWPANAITLDDDPELRHFRIAGGQVADFPKATSAEKPWADDAATHPTVKPLDLMRHLVRLVTPPGGVVLDPFAGTGTTGEAAVIEGRRAVLIEREADYLPLIEARLAKPLQPTLQEVVG